MYSVFKERISISEPLFFYKACPFIQAPAFIAHYIHQSEETYTRRKLNLPADDTNTFRGRDYDIHNKYNNVENTILKDKYGDQIAKFLQQYRK
jgi:hypothetical protein